MGRTKKLPSQGRHYPAKNRRFEETVVFVHHYGGHRDSVTAHREFLNDLGLDCVAFTLEEGHRLTPHVRRRWTQDVLKVLKAVKGPKIVYSFSFPSGPALEAIALAPQGEVRAWICDGGPFLKLLTCFWNYFTLIEPTAIWLKPALLSLAALRFDALTLGADLHAALARLPAHFPILSIRSWQDKLVPISAIDQVFAGHSQLQLETLTLPEAGHIDGLQRFPEEYKPRVAKFINHHASPLEAPV